MADKEMTQLIDELLEARTVYDTVHFLKLQKLSDEEIVKQLQKRYSLAEHEAWNLLREYREVKA